MAAHAPLKNEFTEDEKYLMRWLVCYKYKRNDTMKSDLKTGCHISDKYYLPLYFIIINYDRNSERLPYLDYHIPSFVVFKIKKLKFNETHENDMAFVVLEIS